MITKAEGTAIALGIVCFFIGLVWPPFLAIVVVISGIAILTLTLKK